MAALSSSDIRFSNSTVLNACRSERVKHPERQTLTTTSLMAIVDEIVDENISILGVCIQDYRITMHNFLRSSSDRTPFVRRSVSQNDAIAIADKLPTLNFGRSEEK
ncbi:hypothetical protein AY599_00390 [Leptolyngbya valderiana BDU 20041]|nr:hypothetical protein AY599_00390 [Leptolyngbya valderiana BDU 20041]